MGQIGMRKTASLVHVFRRLEYLHPPRQFFAPSGFANITPRAGQAARAMGHKPAWALLHINTG